MFNSRTLFIIGAGASKEVNLPVGYELSERIAKNLYFEFESFRGMTKGDHHFFQSMRRYVNDDGSMSQEDQNDLVDKYLKAARDIHNGVHLAGSIDNFIDTHKSNPYVAACGKAAIVKAILQAERESMLFIDWRKPSPRLDLMQLEGTWYFDFAQILCERVPLEDIESIFANISIICLGPIYVCDPCQWVTHVYRSQKLRPLCFLVLPFTNKTSI